MEIKFKKLSEIPNDIKEHIMELNIQFAKRYNTLAMSISDYNSIAVETKSGATIYCESDFERTINCQPYLNNTTLFRLCNAIVNMTDNCGIWVNKNRWGDIDSSQKSFI